MTVYTCDLCGRTNARTPIHFQELKLHDSLSRDICDMCNARLKNIIQHKLWRFNEGCETDGEHPQREERERCAKIADKVFSEFDDDYENAKNFLEKAAARLQGDGAAKVARAIRSVGCPT
jgi:hypothetical protein